MSNLKKYKEELNGLEDCLRHFLRGQYSKGVKTSKNRHQLSNAELLHFSKGLEVLRDAFIDRPGQKDPNYLNESDCRSSYILHFLMPNVIRWLHLYEECRVLDTNDLKLEEINVLDVGAGPATSCLAFLAKYHREIKGVVNFYITDLNNQILKDGKEILELYAQSLGVDIRVNIQGGGFYQYPNQLKKAHFILMGNVWNESLSSHESARNKTLQKWTDQFGRIITDETYVIIMEPASRRASRLLMSMRDYFSQEKTPLQIIAPCAAGLNGKPCVLNKINGRPWCHFRFVSEESSFMQDAMKVSSSEHNTLSYSYLILTKKPAKIKIVGRVIGGKMKLEDEYGVYVCHKQGRVLLTSREKEVPSHGKGLIKNIIVEKTKRELRGEIESSSTKQKFSKKPFHKISPKAKPIKSRDHQAKTLGEPSVSPKTKSKQDKPNRVGAKISPLRGKNTKNKDEKK